MINIGYQLVPHLEKEKKSQNKFDYLGLTPIFLYITNLIALSDMKELSDMDRAISLSPP